MEKLVRLEAPHNLIGFSRIYFPGRICLSKGRDGCGQHAGQKCQGNAQSHISVLHQVAFKLLKRPALSFRHQPNDEYYAARGNSP